MAAPKIDRVLLNELSDLARLHVPQEREAGVLDSLQRILDAFSGLQTACLSDLPPDADAPALQPGALRPDEPGETLTRDAVLANAPRVVAGAFVVPRVVDA